MDPAEIGLGMKQAHDDESSPLTWPLFENRTPCCESHLLLVSEKLSLSYANRPAFEGVSLTINKGCITAIVGPSGSGKTSFLMCVNRLTDLIENCHISGKLFLEDLEVFSPKTNVLQLRRRVGMIFQKPNPFPLSIRKNLELPLNEHGEKDTAKIRDLIQHTLVDIGL